MFKRRMKYICLIILNRRTVLMIEILIVYFIGEC